MVCRDHGSTRSRSPAPLVGPQTMNSGMLSAEDVLKIHEVLVRDFASSSDPISPPGVRSMALLESAVGRQWTSLGAVLKHPWETAHDE